MKSTMKFLSLLFTVLILTNTAYAESPREQLKRMVGQLQANPDDDALREKIIKLARQFKPAPAIPEEAERRMVRGTAAFKGAKSVADYRDAAKEFEQATLAAPWYGDAYYNLGVAQDKSENYEDALSSLKLALLASPNSKDIKALIYEVEYRNEKANSAVAAVDQEKKAKKEFIEKLEGAQWVQDGNYDSFCIDNYMEVNRGEIFSGWLVTRPTVESGCEGTIGGRKFKLGDGWSVMNARLEGHDFVFDESHGTFRGTISEDGEKIVLRFSPKPSHPSYPKESTDTYHRVKNPQWTIISR